jgi:hypothetical protein
MLDACRYLLVVVTTLVGGANKHRNRSLPFLAPSKWEGWLPPSLFDLGWRRGLFSEAVLCCWTVFLFEAP